jgi:proteasome lid subunit RPN8/RPN11
MIDHDLLTKPIDGLDPTTILTDELCNQLHTHAVESYPQECIGAIVGTEYVRLENAAKDPESRGDLSPDVILELMQSDLKMVLHSHPDGPNCPSGIDLRTQATFDVPFGLVCTDGEACTAPIFWGDMLARPPLLGRGFVHGWTDCVGLIMDYERVVNGRHMENPIRDWEWWSKEEGVGLYEENFAKWGYEQVHDDLVAGDVIFLKAGSQVVNHAAIYLGDHLILHHLSGRLENDPSRKSVIEPIIRWQQNQRLDKVVRFKETAK